MPIQLGHATLTDASLPSMVASVVYLSLGLIFCILRRSWHWPLFAWSVIAGFVWIFGIDPVEHPGGIVALTPLMVSFPMILVLVFKLWLSTSASSKPFVRSLFPAWHSEMMLFATCLQGVITDAGAAALRTFSGVKGPAVIGGGGFEDGLVWLPPAFTCIYVLLIAAVQGNWSLAKLRALLKR